MQIDRDFIKHLIADYERDIEGNEYTFELSDGETLSFLIRPKDVPHLLGVRKLPLRQVQHKSAQAVYNMLKDGRINIFHIGAHKEEFKKVVNFHYVLDILNCGEAVKIVKRVGRLNSSYFLYLDCRPERIVHLGIVKDDEGYWHPESLLINLWNNAAAYIEGQTPVDILKRTVTRKQ